MATAYHTDMADDVAVGPIDTLRRYWFDANYRAQEQQEREERRARFNAAMAAHDARERARQEARWAAEEAAANQEAN